MHNETEHFQRIRNHPIFICGHPKAGTSLVRAILDSHPELIVYPEESMFFRRFLPKTRNCKLDEKLDLAEKNIINFFRWEQENPTADQEGFPDRDYRNFSFEEINKWMRTFVENSFRDDGDILSAAVLAFGVVSNQLHQNTRYWVEKSPYNEYYAEQIFTWWSDARCIHVIRDPRDNYISYKRKHPDWQAEFFASNWRCSTLAGVQNQEKYKPENYYILHYEDLTSSPENAIRQLTAFLKISWDETLLIPSRAKELWKGNSMFSNQFEGISAAPVARWKENLSRQDAEVIQIITEPLFTQFKYSDGEIEQKISGKARWRARSWPLRRRLQRFYQA